MINLIHLHTFNYFPFSYTNDFAYLIEVDIRNMLLELTVT
jgi:hypothetical protein